MHRTLVQITRISSVTNSLSKTLESGRFGTISNLPKVPTQHSYIVVSSSLTQNVKTIRKLSGHSSTQHTTSFRR